ncbi:uncharacterized protein PHALS_12371 [Plasmopara halstedii]|uniref:Uncharacterized protein n=1 Tax=Plasmopara halstedii TaxID=4781 RepID=A0A0P1AM87_PLAHL|nr:uncharacterized protein PHALS_12371 [Plasmopara halstedii]CEG42065.1 hypothetical protein PHALS_12371 [Plasmopara halstedii]|eukprot:XP_024578434.1 hypothetical protein PHALS_12371 [Plasmopara halstedii]
MSGGPADTPGLQPVSYEAEEHKLDHFTTEDEAIALIPLIEHDTFRHLRQQFVVPMEGVNVSGSTFFSWHKRKVRTNFISSPSAQQAPSDGDNI